MRKLLSQLVSFVCIAAAVADTSVSHRAKAMVRTGLPGAAVNSEAQSPEKIIRVVDTPALSDAEIAYIYLQANLAEVEKAELGATRGTMPEVKQHGEMVARDHRGVVKSFEGILLKNSIKPTPPADSEASVAQHQALMADLKARSGADFDRAYLAHESANHRAVIDAVRGTLLPAVKSEAIAAHLKEVLPAFERHLGMTVEAARKAGVSEKK